MMLRGEEAKLERRRGQKSTRKWTEKCKEESRRCRELEHALAEAQEGVKGVQNMSSDQAKRGKAQMNEVHRCS
jgi:hypothetical protein